MCETEGVWEKTLTRIFIIRIYALRSDKLAESASMFIYSIIQFMNII